MTGRICLFGGRAHHDRHPQFRKPTRRRRGHPGPAGFRTYVRPPTLEAESETTVPARPTGLAVAVSGQSVTLTWDDPGNSGISYQYQVNHNDTGTGKLTGWSSWQDITDPSTTGPRLSHTIDGHTYGKEYRYKIRAAKVQQGQEVPEYSKPAPAAAPWYLSVTITDPRPPALSHLWTVRVCDDLFKVRWHFVPGATGYDLEMSGNHRHSWQRKMTNKNKNGWQFSKWTKNATFWFRVRAVNAHGSSDWRYVKSIAPPCAVTGVQATRMPSADGQSGTITATWDPAHRASGYDVDFTADNGRSWQRMVTDLRATSYTFTKHIPYNPNYRVSVQSRRKGVTSGWTTAPIAGLTVADVAGTTATLNFNGYSGNWYYKASEPPDDALCNGPVSGAVKDLTGLHAGTDYQYTAYSDSGCTDAISSVTFSTPVTLTVSNVTATGATLNLDGHNLQWWYDADTGPHTTCQGPVAANDSDEDLTGLTAHQQYTYKAYNASGCNAGDLLTSLTFEPSGDVLTTESLEATTAVLRLSHHIGNWWFKQTAPSEGSCTAGEADFTNALSDLIPGTEYTYKSYDVSDCGDTHVGASVDFTTVGVSVSNLDATATTGCPFGSLSDFNEFRQKCGVRFRTGSASNGYTLHSVTGRFGDKSGSPTGFTIALHEASGNYPGSVISTATLSGSTPDTAGEYTYTCSGSGCELSASTTYHVVLSTSNTSGTHFYRLETTAATSETLVPPGNGWLISDKGTTHQATENSNLWQDASYATKIKVAATAK